MLSALIYQLDSRHHDPASRPERSAAEILKEVTYLAQRRFWQYTPSQAVPFEGRLEAWLRNSGLADSDVLTMLETAAALQFVDRDDLAALYKSAFRGPVWRWIVDSEGWDLDRLVSLTDGDVKESIGATWFCSVTDSMDIGQFLRINGIAGSSHRPGWKTLNQFGNFDLVRAFVATRGFRRLVLLEDFVGTGTQAISSIHAALNELAIPVLFCPLTTSELAVKKFRRIAEENARFQFEPAYIVPLGMHVFAKEYSGEPELFSRIRALALKTFPEVRKKFPGESDTPRSAFGFNRISALLFVQYTNCPNNTLPLIWHDSPAWNALFPRVSRQ